MLLTFSLHLPGEGLAAMLRCPCFHLLLGLLVSLSLSLSINDVSFTTRLKDLESAR